MFTRRSIMSLAAGGASAALAGTSRAQDVYPNRMIRFMVPFPPGQISDAIARLIADDLKITMGQNVLVENRPGQAGSIGAAAFSRLPADGYHLFLGATAAFGPNAFLYRELGYDPLRDFQPVTMVSRTRLLLMVGKHVPVTNVAELIALMRKEPDRLSYASSGVGTISHTTMEAFKLATGGGATHVPFQGIGASTAALLGGHIDMMIDATFSVIQHIRAGNIRPLAMAMTARDPLLPETPTLAEVGVPGFGHTSWTAIFVPANTPRPIVDRLNTEIRKAIAKPEFQRRLEGLDIFASTPDEAAEIVRKDYAYWGDVLTRSGLAVRRP